MRLRVVWGLSETIATFWPTSRLTSVDLPTLGRPTTVTKPARNGRVGLSSALGVGRVMLGALSRRKRTRLTRLRSASTTSISKPR